MVCIGTFFRSNDNIMDLKKSPLPKSGLHQGGTKYPQVCTKEEVFDPSLRYRGRVRRRRRVTSYVLHSFIH